MHPSPPRPGGFGVRSAILRDPDGREGVEEGALTPRTVGNPAPAGSVIHVTVVL